MKLKEGKYPADLNRACATITMALNDLGITLDEFVLWYNKHVIKRKSYMIISEELLRTIENAGLDFSKLAGSLKKVDYL